MFSNISFREFELPISYILLNVRGAFRSNNIAGGKHILSQGSIKRPLNEWT